MNASLPLRPYQVTAITLLTASIASGHRSPLVQLPTGSGKTRIAAEIAIRALTRFKTVAFIIPRISLIEQTVAAFEREGITDVGVIQGVNWRTNPDAVVQIVSAQTAGKRKTLPKFDLIIIDEAHIRSEFITSLFTDPERKDCFFVGLTATPWSKGLGKIYDDLIQPGGIQELMDLGFLTKLIVYAPPAPDLKGVRTIAGDFSEGDLSAVCCQKEIVGNVVTTWLEKAQQRQTLCFGVDRKHSQHLQERFIEAGIAAEYVDGDTKMYDREDVFARFRTGETKIICNVAVLDTGIDLPNASCIIDARPTRSRIRFVQTVGRGLRPAEGKDSLIVCDHGGNHSRLGRITEQYCATLDDGEDGSRPYEKGPAGEEYDIKLCPECNAVLAPKARICDACGHQLFAVSLVREIDGDLVELGTTAPKFAGLSMEEKHNWYSGVYNLCLEKGQNPNRAFYLFIARFNGEKPPWSWRTSVLPVTPTVEQRNFVRSRDIAFAKSRAGYG